MGYTPRIMGDDSLFIFSPAPICLICHSWDASAIPRWESDIAAAFAVDRPDWRWEMEDYDHNHFDVAVYAIGPDGSLGAFYDQRLDRKPTPQDYAHARCVAALLLAAKIGE